MTGLLWKWLGIIVLACSLGAHEIPRDVKVEMWLKPEAGKMTIAARVPLKAMRDVVFPEVAGGYLDVEKLEPQLPVVATTWVSNAILLREGGRELGRPQVVGTRLALQSDKTFEAFGRGVKTAFGSEARVVWDQLWLDVLMEIPVGDVASRFAVRPGMQGLGLQVLTVMRFGERAFELHGDAGWVELDPSWWGAFRRFTVLGFWHILEGMDHLLFLFCLVIPVRQLGRLVWVVSAFTVGHSLTLIGAAMGLGPDALWFPALVELAIAASIVWMSLENVFERGGRWVVAALFGLVHGFGFSFALRESLQFAGSHLMSSLVAFNVGVELGQLLVVGLLWGVFQVVKVERLGVIVLSTLVAHTGWHWMLERWELLAKYWR